MIKRSIASLVICCAVAWQSASAEFFRWTDENGETHYSDRVPAEHTKQGREVINDGGRIIDRVNRALTPEELTVLEEQQRIEKIKRERAEKQRAHDRALLATFTSVEDMENARDERIALLDQTITIAYSRLEKQKDEMSKLDDSRRQFVSKDMEIPAWIKDNENQLRVQIGVIEEYILDRELEKSAIKKKFDKDIDRFLELTGHALTSDKGSDTLISK